MQEGGTTGQTHSSVMPSAPQPERVPAQPLAPVHAVFHETFSVQAQLAGAPHTSDAPAASQRFVPGQPAGLVQDVPKPAVAAEQPGVEGQAQTGVVPSAPHAAKVPAQPSAPVQAVFHATFSVQAQLAGAPHTSDAPAASQRFVPGQPAGLVQGVPKPAVAAEQPGVEGQAQTGVVPSAPHAANVPAQPSIPVHAVFHTRFSLQAQRSGAVQTSAVAEALQLRTPLQPPALVQASP